MELAAMALILTAVLVGQYFIYKRFGLFYFFSAKIVFFLKKR